MRLPFLRSKEDPASGRGRAPASGTGDPALDAAHARTRARQRLVGAVVLLAAGVVGFPILFETKPRPLPVDTPIEIVRAGGSSAGPTAAGKVQPATLPPLDAGIEISSAASAAVVAMAPSAQPSAPASAARAARPASAAVLPERPARPPAEAPSRPKPASAPVAAPSAPPTPASAAQAARFVVQAGAYLDAASLRDARQKVERLGLKTYTQVVETPTGKRTRVRVGPFESRAEADGVAERIKASGLSVVVLTL